MACKYRIDILTLFPTAVSAMMDESIIGRAQKHGFVELACHQIRDYTTNKQNQVDDYPYGGGRGCVMQAQPLYDCWRHAMAQGSGRVRTIYLSPCGSVFDQDAARRLASDYDRLILVCGHYEGVDQRFIDECCDEEISIGDFVLTGGEIPAMAVADAVLRMIPGVLSDDECFTEESHWHGTLEYPQYSRPEVWRGRRVPEVLLSGHHANIARWRRKQSLQRTLQRRPDLFGKLRLASKQDKKIMEEIWEEYRMDLQKRIREYAALLVRSGLNMQKGQKLVLNCPVERADFARILTQEAYAAGCGEVILNWRDDVIDREKYLHASDEVFDTVPEWRVAFYNEAADGKYGWMGITGSDPEALKGVLPDRLRRAQMASAKALGSFQEKEMANWFPWCVAAAPTEAWARKVFPNLQGEKAINALWEAILATARVDGKGRAAENWEAHCAAIQERTGKLNAYRFKSLHYKNSLGTDLEVELPDGHIWAGGTEKCADGYPFCANIPTEEIFTMPKKTGVNGVVCSSLPLSLHGDLAENFKFTIENGKIVKVKAEKGQKLLEDAIALDEGAGYLGEVALVPWDSPIRASGLLFYNTLFDENASCHFAFGAAYSTSLTGAESMTEEEREARGMNISKTHVDFMVGTEDLSIVGTTADGTEVVVFKDGRFAF